MSKPLIKQDGTTTVIELPGIGIIFAAGPTPPSDGTAGFSPNCFFIHTDGTAPDDSLYLNVGTTRASCNFDPLNLTI